MFWTSLTLAAMVVPLGGVQEPAHVQASLISEHESLTPGTTQWVAVQMEIEKGWHTYWDGRNTTGTPPIIKFTLPAGYRAGDIRWPGPQRHVAYGDQLDHIHEGRVLLLVPIEVPRDAKPGTKVDLAAECMFVVCQDVCIMERAKPSLSLTVGEAGATPKPSKHAPLFVTGRKRLPVPLKEVQGVTAKVDKDILVIEAPGATRVSFFPSEDSAETPGLLKEGEAKGEKLKVILAPSTEAPRVKGVVEVVSRDSKEPRFIAIDLPVSK